MRVAMVSEHASPLAALGGVDAGGQNVHVAELARALARGGHQVVVHTRCDDARLPEWVPLAHGVSVHHVAAGPPTSVPKDELLPYMDAFAEDLARVWETLRPDIVHAHFWMSGSAALAAARPLGVPVVLTFHALGVVKRRHQGAADTSPPERLAAERAVALGADHIVATARDEVHELRAMGAPPDGISVVPCGVDLDHFTPDGPPEARRSARPRVLVVGRLVQRKGLDDAIRALAAIPGAELVVAGGPPAASLEADPEAQRLLALARGLGVADRLELRGRVARKEMPALVRSADVVACVPWYEPFGIVPLEAMACGVPVVASAVGGQLDSVVDGVTGVHVPPRDPAALAAAVCDLLEHPERRRALGAAGLRRARGRFGWDRIAADTLAVYDAVAEPHAPVDLGALV